VTEGAVPDEALMIDGALQIRMLRTILVPVAMPGIIAAAIFAFTVSLMAGRAEPGPPGAMTENGLRAS